MDTSIGFSLRTPTNWLSLDPLFPHGKTLSFFFPLFPPTITINCKKTHNLFPGVDVVNISKRRSVQNTFLPRSMHFFATSVEGSLYHIGILLQGSFFLFFFRRRIVSYFLSQGNAGALANDLWAICRKN